MGLRLQPWLQLGKVDAVLSVTIWVGFGLGLGEKKLEKNVKTGV